MKLMDRLLNKIPFSLVIVLFGIVSLSCVFGFYVLMFKLIRMYFGEPW